MNPQRCLLGAGIPQVSGLLGVPLAWAFSSRIALFPQGGHVHRGAGRCAGVSRCRICRRLSASLSVGSGLAAAAGGGFGGLRDGGGGIDGVRTTSLWRVGCSRTSSSLTSRRGGRTTAIGRQRSAFGLRWGRTRERILDRARRSSCGRTRSAEPCAARRATGIFRAISWGSRCAHGAVVGSVMAVLGLVGAGGGLDNHARRGSSVRSVLQPLHSSTAASNENGL